MISPLYSIKTSPSAMLISANTPLPCTQELRTAVRFIGAFLADFKSDFRGEVFVFESFGAGFFVATFYIFEAAGATRFRGEVAVFADFGAGLFVATV